MSLKRNVVMINIHDNSYLLNMVFLSVIDKNVEIM